MRSSALAFSALILALPALAGWAAWRTSLASEIDALETRAATRLNIANARLESQLARFRQLPRVLADAAPLAEAMAAPTPARLQEANLLLERVADVTGALDIYLMDPGGLTKAASNWAAERPFIGRNFRFRPYFRRAMDGGLGVFYALGTTSDKRGFYFASPLRMQGEIVGVAAVKVDMEAVESDWRDAGETIYFTDPYGVIFIANRAGLVFRTLAPLSQTAIQAIAATRRYSDRPLVPLPPERAVAWTPARVMRMDGPGWRDIRGLPARALHAQLTNPRLDMTAHVLMDARPALERARLAGLGAAATALALALLALLILQRRNALRQRLALEASANAGLEARVAARTRALSDANAHLRREVGERRAAEDALRRAQDDLVQAGKLSALGQMSAGISHELNQPLAAIRSFADNARVLLERGRVGETSANLAQISDLTARMARIIRNLRAFARKEGEPASDVALDRIVADALELMARRIETEGVRIDWTPPAAPAMVRGGEVRLGQVAVNVLSNAMDAMEGQADKRIVIRIAPRPGGGARLTIRDNGPGLGLDAGKNLFDPFYTTKSVGQGEGLGLGLSISYGIVQSFGGAIRGETHREGGAIFTIDLQPGLVPDAP